jgi:hypothetical protein
MELLIKDKIHNNELIHPVIDYKPSRRYNSIYNDALEEICDARCLSDYNKGKYCKEVYKRNNM